MVEIPAAVVTSLIQSLNDAETKLARLDDIFTAALVGGTIKSVAKSLQQEVDIAEKLHAEKEAS